MTSFCPSPHNSQGEVNNVRRIHWLSLFGMNIMYVSSRDNAHLV